MASPARPNPNTLAAVIRNSLSAYKSVSPRRQPSSVSVKRVQLSRVRFPVSMLCPPQGAYIVSTVLSSSRTHVGEYAVIGQISQNVHLLSSCAIPL
jgi:hypothetical protein